MPSLMLVVNPAIQFMTYESIKRRVTASLGGAQPPVWVFFAIGAIAKTIATTLTYPLQLVQTKLRVRRGIFYERFFKSEIKTIDAISRVSIKIDIKGERYRAILIIVEYVGNFFQHGHKYPNLRPNAGTLQILLYVLK